MQRTLKFVKYLGEFGWDPVVVTTSSRSYPAQDPSLAAEIPAGVPVVRTGGIPALGRARVLGGEAFRRLHLPSVGSAVTFPDNYAEWMPAAVRAGVRTVREHDIDAIFVSSPPFSGVMAALTIARRTGLPLVTDFRDEWLANDLGATFPGPVERIGKRWERRVLDESAAITVAAPHYVIGGRSGFTTITNGVDPDDMAPPGPPRDDGRFRLTYAGTLYGDIDLRPVTDSLQRLAAAGEIDPRRFELRLVGNVWLPEQPTAGQVRVDAVGYLPHAGAVEEMRDADVLLSYTPMQTRNIPAKLFEYLAAGRPILSVSNPESVNYKLVRELGAGAAADVSDPAAIDDAVKSLYTAWESGSLVAADREAVLERFSRRKLAGHLAAVLSASGRA